MIATVSANIGDYSFSPTYEIHTLVEQKKPGKQTAIELPLGPIYADIQPEAMPDTYFNRLDHARCAVCMQNGNYCDNVLFTFNAKSMVIAPPMPTLAGYLRYLIKIPREEDITCMHA